LGFALRKLSLLKHFAMLIKLDTSAFRLSRHKAETAKKVVAPLTRDQWITADRIVMIAMFIATIVGAILF
jgi:hypothetical protein